MTIKILLVDDQTLVRQGIKSLLALSSDMDVIAEAEAFIIKNSWIAHIECVCVCLTGWEMLS